MTRLKELAQSSCANYEGRYCLLRDKPCPFVYEDRSCQWFWEAVLHQDKELYARIRDGKGLGNDPARQRICAGCGGEFMRENNRQIYCSSCAQARRLEKERERKRDARRKKRTQSALSAEDNMILAGL